MQALDAVLVYPNQDAATKLSLGKQKANLDAMAAFRKHLLHTQRFLDAYKAGLVALGRSLHVGLALDRVRESLPKTKVTFADMDSEIANRKEESETLRKAMERRAIKVANLQSRKPKP